MADSGFSVTIKSWTPVAIWKWEVPDETCGICMADMDGCAPGVKFPGDECPPVFGRCGHAFHMPCLMKWLESRTDATGQICPLCRQPWEFVEFKSPSRGEPAPPVAAAAAAAAGAAAPAETPADGEVDAAEGSDMQSGGSSVMDFDLSDATH